MSKTRDGLHVTVICWKKRRFWTSVNTFQGCLVYMLKSCLSRELRVNPRRLGATRINLGTTALLKNSFPRIIQFRHMNNHHFPLVGRAIKPSPITLKTAALILQFGSNKIGRYSLHTVTFPQCNVSSNFVFHTTFD